MSNSKIASAEYAPQSSIERQREHSTSQLNNSVAELAKDVKQQIPKPSTNMRNSMNSGMWETNPGVPPS